VRWVRALIVALGQPRAGGETRYFMKFGALQMLALPLIRMAFPETPWIFVYRDPVEILVSLSKARPAFATPGIAIGGFLPVAPEEAQAMHPDEYAARLLYLIGSTAAQAIEAGQGLPLNYKELPGAMWSSVPCHFRCEWGADETEAMRRASLRNAKYPSTQFAPDTEAKQREASPELRMWAAKWVGETFERLEAARRNRTAPPL
jgi:hypothetical protein